MDRRSIDALILSLASRSGMVVTGRQLADAGVSAHLLETRHGRLLTRFSHGVYVVGDLTPDARIRAALAALPAAALSHRTAATRCGLAVPEPATIELLTRQPTRRRLDGVHVRTTCWLPPADVGQIDGVRVTTVARTLCDLASVVTRGRLRHLIESAVTDGRTTGDDVLACAAAYRRRGRPGSGVLRAVHQSVFGGLLDDAPLAASELERRTHRLLHAAGITGWVVQFQPPWYDGVRGVVDLAWPQQRVVVELDGRRWHATTQAQADDRRRDRLAVAHGWITIRFGWHEVTRRPAAVAAEIRSVLDARPPSPPG